MIWYFYSNVLSDLFYSHLQVCNLYSKKGFFYITHDPFGILGIEQKNTSCVETSHQWCALVPLNFWVLHIMLAPTVSQPSSEDNRYTPSNYRMDQLKYCGTCINNTKNFTWLKKIPKP